MTYARVISTQRRAGSGWRRRPSCSSSGAKSVNEVCDMSSTPSQRFQPVSRDQLSVQSGFPGGRPRSAAPMIRTGRSSSRSRVGWKAPSRLTPARIRRSASIDRTAAAPPMECPTTAIRDGSMSQPPHQGEAGPVPASFLLFATSISRSITNDTSAARPPATVGPSGSSSPARHSVIRPLGKVVATDS